MRVSCTAVSPGPGRAQQLSFAVASPPSYSLTQLLPLSLVSASLGWNAQHDKCLSRVPRCPESCVTPPSGYWLAFFGGGSLGWLCPCCCISARSVEMTVLKPHLGRCWTGFNNFTTFCLGFALRNEQSHSSQGVEKVVTNRHEQLFLQSDFFLFLSIYFIFCQFIEEKLNMD